MKVSIVIDIIRPDKSIRKKENNKSTKLIENDKSFEDNDNEKKIELNESNKPIKLKNILFNIRNEYILQLISNILKRKKSLEIIKYNKAIQNKLDININDYKKYYEEIELEIFTEKFGPSGNFINIEKGQESYFHIYHKENNKEIKRNYINEDNGEVSKIRIIIDPQIKSFNSLFANCYNIKSIHFKRFNRNDINDMGRMFMNDWGDQKL